ncbi:hypothetical protein ACFO3K_01830 [Cellulomonas algicola]|uniref:hypothetical protein n=1 Tax=Cellulomonas algicola TaxID=2071633 RepID=UPI001C3FDF9F|nr:hypothetical protein [Cellulomonas algicola]
MAERPAAACMARAAVRAAVVSILALTAAGCSADEAPVETEWKPPAWFAEQAREREEVAAKMQTCMDAKGWTVTLDEYGGAAEPFTSEDEANRFSEDSMACQEEAGRRLGALTEDELREAYTRDVDTMMCLRNEGFDMADPPTVDTYVESRLADPPPDDLWVPYTDPAVQGALESGSLSADGLVELERTCPQNWS